MNTTTRICTRCLEEKLTTEFYFKDKRRGLRHPHCGVCERELFRKRWQANRAKYLRQNCERKKQLRKEQRELIRNYLELHPCVDCGEADPCCLDFDHVRGKKLYMVSRMICQSRPWEKILIEIKKCEVRCANCHRKRHAKRQKEWHSPAGIAPP